MYTPKWKKSLFLLTIACIAAACYTLVVNTIYNLLGFAERCLMDINSIHQDLIESLHRLQTLEVTEDLVAFSQGEVRALSFLWQQRDSGREIFPTDISAALDVSRQRITSILASLRKKGFIDMDMSETDRRKMRVTLTDKGKDYFLRRQQRARARFLELAEKLGEQDTKELARLTKRVAWIMADTPR